MFIFDDQSAKNISRVNEASKAINNAKSEKEKKLEKEKFSKIKEFLKICEKHKFDTTPPDYKTGTKCGNMVGDRIRVMLQEENMTITDLAKKSGVSRSTLQRYLSNDDPDIPTAKKLDQVIAAFPYPYEDFLFSPEDFEEWKYGLVYGHAVQWTETFQDYDIFAASVIASFAQTFVYGDGIKKYRVPDHIMDLLIKQITTAFQTTNELLAYEKQKTNPKVYYMPTVDEIEI